MQQNVAKGWYIITVLLLLFPLYLGGNSISFTVSPFLVLSSDHKQLETQFFYDLRFSLCLIVTLRVLLRNFAEHCCSSSSGPGAYAPDAPQPVGLLCVP